MTEKVIVFYFRLFFYKLMKKNDWQDSFRAASFLFFSILMDLTRIIFTFFLLLCELDIILVHKNDQFDQFLSVFNDFLTQLVVFRQ